MHESQLHEANCFITLTEEQTSLQKRRPLEYKNESNYADSLSIRDAQLFMKRLRKELTKINPSTKIKFYLVGEYGDKNGRPHYHAAIFGEDFHRDRFRDRKSPSGEQLYRSPTLEKTWTKGYSSIGDLTFQSAAYIARYVMKKQLGRTADSHYERETPEGERYWITPEFALMSRGGTKGKGIAHGWFTKYGTDAYPNDFVVMNGHQHKPPRYYDKLYELIDKEGATLMKLEREFTSRSKKADNTPSRLRVREQVAIARLASLKRHL